VYGGSQFELKLLIGAGDPTFAYGFGESPDYPEPPDGMTISDDGDGATINWAIPSDTEDGVIFQFVPYASNDCGTDYEYVTLRVFNPALHVPIVNTIDDQVVLNTADFYYQATVSQGEEESLEWSLSGEPEGMTIGQYNGQIRWADPIGSIGNPYFVSVIATNSVGVDSENFSLYVLCPSLAAPVEQTPNLTSPTCDEANITFSISTACGNNGKNWVLDLPMTSTASWEIYDLTGYDECVVKLTILEEYHKINFELLCHKTSEGGYDELSVQAYRRDITQAQLNSLAAGGHVTLQNCIVACNDQVTENIDISIEMSEC
jgi:hypothetical protein